MLGYAARNANVFDGEHLGSAAADMRFFHHHFDMARFDNKELISSPEYATMDLTYSECMNP